MAEASKHNTKAYERGVAFALKSVGGELGCDSCTMGSVLKSVRRLRSERAQHEARVEELERALRRIAARSQRIMNGEIEGTLFSACLYNVDVVSEVLSVEEAGDIGGDDV